MTQRSVSPPAACRLALTESLNLWQQAHEDLEPAVLEAIYRELGAGPARPA